MAHGLCPHGPCFMFTMATGESEEEEEEEEEEGEDEEEAGAKMSDGGK